MLWRQFAVANQNKHILLHKRNMNLSAKYNQTGAHWYREVNIAYWENCNRRVKGQLPFK